MYKIKLLILLLISLFVLSCADNRKPSKKYLFSLSNIGGEYDGLVLSNILRSHLAGYNSIDPSSRLEIQSNIQHSTSIYITNIDNTSDREKVETVISVKIYNEDDKCYVYKFNKMLSQFYVFASNENFISNQKALEQIKYENTEELVKNFINELFYIELECLEKY